jgi:hypothetical protein
MNWNELLDKQGDNIDSDLENKVWKTLNKHNSKCRIAYARRA